jgi:hypothetical protein
MIDPRVQAQMKIYEEAMALFHQQKFQRAKQELEKVLEGPSKELVDRAGMHIRIVEQRMKPAADQNPKSPEDHYQRGVGMMNLGRWDEARSLANLGNSHRKRITCTNPAALDCLTGKRIRPCQSEDCRFALPIDTTPNDKTFAFSRKIRGFGIVVP